MVSFYRMYHHLGDQNLQEWYQIEIVHERHHKVVYFHSRIHVNKKVEIPPNFTNEFTDYEILRDRTLITNILSRYGANIFRK